jgi:hypothetical protein
MVVYRGVWRRKPDVTNQPSATPGGSYMRSHILLTAPASSSLDASFRGPVMCDLSDVIDNALEGVKDLRNFDD